MSDDRDKSADRPRRVRPGRIRAERSEGRGLLAWGYDRNAIERVPQRW